MTHTVFCYHCRAFHPVNEVRNTRAKPSKRWRCIRSLAAPQTGPAERELPVRLREEAHPAPRFVGEMRSAPDSSSRLADGALWSVAIFAARETPEVLLLTIDAIVRAASKPTVIDVMVNGNPGLAAQITHILAITPISGGFAHIRVWSVPLGGKAHTWNQYLHLVWPGRGLAFFVDGYARPMPDALELLAAGMAADQVAIAGTGIPTSGRTAPHLREQMQREGGLQGNFFALKEAAMHQLKNTNFRLPLGLYGFDTLLGAVLGFGLDPARNPWNAKGYILVHQAVTWSIDAKKWWRYAEIKTHSKRILNNALRVLVIQATKNFLAQRKLPPEQLPRTVEEFVLSWVENYPDDARQTLWRSPLSRLALQKLRAPRDWSAAALAPQQVFATQSVTSGFPLAAPRDVVPASGAGEWRFVGARQHEEVAV